MKINLDSESEDLRIEIVPLIDVIFCVLTFFMLATLYFARLQLNRQQAVNVDLPKASTGTTPQQPERLIVRIDPPYGQVYVDDMVNPPEPIISKDQLREKLQQFRAAKPEGLMVLWAGKDVRYEDVVQVLDQMRQVGGDRVALATIPESLNQLPGSGSLPPTGIPGLPGGGVNPPVPYNPYNVPNPVTPFNPNQPQLPAQPGVTPVPPGGNFPTPPGTGVTPTPTLPRRN
ncbi:biopolymer transporter ExbD [Microseira sp. BLCC-F43]|jgi:biopolymer transport protein ExbD|uniref:biopolymer transporter ExbD n=1 Tax=Microseira sp. BLCC-F43 TaxID=3153602 RepID=UPI0035B9740B